MPLYELATQEVFEIMWFHSSQSALPGTRQQDRGWILYHTAKWCKPCQRLNIEAIIEAAEKRDLAIWRVDQDVNDYTSGYCSVQSIPTFQFCRPKQIVDTLKPRDTADVLGWIATL